MEWYKRWEAFAKREDKAENPGQINAIPDLTRIMVTRSLVEFGDLEHFFTDYNLKDGAKEDVHYKVFDEATWKYLY